MLADFKMQYLLRSRPNCQNYAGMVTVENYETMWLTRDKFQYGRQVRVFYLVQRWFYNVYIIYMIIDWSMFIRFIILFIMLWMLFIKNFVNNNKQETTKFWVEEFKSDFIRCIRTRNLYTSFVQKLKRNDDIS